MRIEITKIADGLGYGEGDISTRERTDVDEATIAAGVEVVKNPAILVDVDRDKNGEPIDDDGCGDGRGVLEIWEGFSRRNKSLNRAKVFGAGVAMGAADEIGSGRATGKSLKATFFGAIDRLKGAGLNFGGHTDEHEHDSKCGCGAIDKAPQIIANTIKYESQIRGSISALGISEDGLDGIFGNYRAFDKADPKYEEYNGAEVMGRVKGDGKVTKKLEGGHKEFFILLNTVQGKTVDQEAIRAATGGKLQAFAVDVWRLQEIAEKLHPEDPMAQKQAFMSELVYTLAVGATLTKGDLPVYVINPVEQLAAA